MSWQVRVHNLAGVGGVTALKLIQKHGSLEAVMAQLDTSRYGIPDPFPFQEARALFKGITSVDTPYHHLALRM